MFCPLHSLYEEIVTLLVGFICVQPDVGFAVYMHQAGAGPDRTVQHRFYSYAFGYGVYGALCLQRGKKE